MFYAPQKLHSTPVNLLCSDQRLTQKASLRSAAISFTVVVVLSLSIVCSAHAHATAPLIDQSQWGFTGRIEPSNPSTAGLHAVDFPWEYVPYLNAVKIIDNHGHEVPYVSNFRVGTDALGAQPSSTFIRDEVYYPTIAVQRIQNQADYVMDLGSSGRYHSRGKINTDTAPFAVNYDLYVSDDGQTWKAVSVSRFPGLLSNNTLAVFHDCGLFCVNNLAFSYPETNKRFLKISVRKIDPQEIPDIKSVDLYGTKRSLIFDYDPRTTYIVYFENSTAVETNLDAALLEDINTYSDIGNVPTATITNLLENTNYPHQKRLT
jgi:hypothetical protein